LGRRVEPFNTGKNSGALVFSKPLHCPGNKRAGNPSTLSVGIGEEPFHHPALFFTEGETSQNNASKNCLILFSYQNMSLKRNKEHM
jgi:hypothetical protein